MNIMHNKTEKFITQLRHVMQWKTTLTYRQQGLTENAGRENDGPSKLQDMKLQDIKLQDRKLQDMKMPDMKMQDRHFHK